LVSVKETMNIIKTDEKFKKVFHFETDSKTNFNYMIPDEELRKQFSFVDWIYMSTLSQATLIGIIEQGKIFTTDTDGETFELCESFFEIPFRLVKIYLRGKNYKFKLHNDSDHEDYLENLKSYSQWCINNNIKIDEKYLDILKP